MERYHSHTRQSSANSASSITSPKYSLSSPSDSSRPSSKRKSIFSRFKTTTSADKSHKSSSSDEWDVACRGEDLEDNFEWPSQSWEHNMVPSTPPLIDSRPSSGVQSHCSQGSVDSDCYSVYTPSNTQRSSDALSQPVRTSYALGNSLEYKLLGSLVPYAEDDSLADFKTSGEMATVHLPEPEGLLLPVAAALSLLPPLPKRNSCCPSPPQKDFQLEDINHSKLSNQSPNPERGNQRVELSPSTSSGTSGSTIYEERQQRRKRDEQLATEAISALFSQKSLQPTSRDDDLPVRPSLLSLRLPNLRALSDTVEIPSAQVTTTQESLQKLGSPFQVKPVSPSHKSFQGGAFRKTFYHPRRPTKPINLAEICLNEPHIQGRRPRVEQRPKSLISVQEELSGNERQPGYNPSSLSQNVTNRKSSAYYDFI